MDLFSTPIDPAHNWLPKEGIAHYHGPIFNSETANKYYQALFNEIAWAPDEAMIFGKRIITKERLRGMQKKPILIPILK